jgi:AcrR family transcriptional regulator
LLAARNDGAGALWHMGFMEYEGCLTTEDMRVVSRLASENSGTEIRTPRLQRGKDRVAALMAAGEAVFAEKGFDAATMTEIAARAGAAIGSLYQFFPTKELLAAALHVARLDELLSMLDAVKADMAGRSAASLADQVLAGMVAFLDGHPAFIALAERRDIDKARKQAAGTAMRARIAALMAGATPPLTAERAEVVAILIMQLMKATVAISGADDKAIRARVIAELRRMLTLYLDAGEPDAGISDPGAGPILALE